MTEPLTPVAQAHPTTVKGRGLAGALRKPRTMPDPEVDWDQWIADIEAEARASAEAENAELRAALVEARKACGSYMWLGNNLHNSDTQTFRDLFAAALEDTVAAYSAASRLLAAPPAEPVE